MHIISHMDAYEPAVHMHVYSILQIPFSVSYILIAEIALNIIMQFYYLQ